ncbi:hypothetical protein CLOSTASPAR_00834 [[Clostridium] asparagiforme DSM 15981]|uniref:Uncharacterized protein n=1 Tax=[Clostridium] asparagiforme DSM 15981 TaxID=518636 RepID=C0CV33_9FIRM|nr:hypothetical protein CLOSTASPAR_00834 [[Clostridium] asparagiforme DSM 15981]
MKTNFIQSFLWVLYFVILVKKYYFIFFSISILTKYRFYDIKIVKKTFS